jgi:hypothetical protein
LLLLKNSTDSTEKQKENNDESNLAWNTSDNGEAEETVNHSVHEAPSPYDNP